MSDRIVQMQAVNRSTGERKFFSNLFLSEAVSIDEFWTWAREAQADCLIKYPNEEWSIQLHTTQSRDFIDTEGTGDVCRYPQI
jgi:hypothetical protein